MGTDPFCLTLDKRGLSPFVFEKTNKKGRKRNGMGFRKIIKLYKGMCQLFLVFSCN